MVVFDVPPAADPVYARQRGMEAISAALRSNSRAPRAPLAPGPQMMTRQQMEALGVEMQSHAGQRFAMMNGETSIFNYANDAAYTSDCTKAEYEAREQMNNAALEMGVSADVRGEARRSRRPSAAPALVKDEGADCCDQRRVLGRATVRSKVS